MKIRGTAISCSSYKKKEKDKNEKFLHEKLEKLHNIFIKSNSVDTAGDGHGFHIFLST
jgi:hypothetical protein